MKYNTMYDVYKEICDKMPGVPLVYNDSYDCISYVTEKYEITALSNYSKPVISIRNSGEQYQFGIGNFEDASKFMTDLIAGRIQFSYDPFSRFKRLKIDGWTNSTDRKKEQSNGQAAMAIGIILMIIAGVLSIATLSTAIEEVAEFWDNFFILPLWIGMHATGLFLVNNKDKVKILDFIGYLAGTCVTSFAVTLAIGMMIDGDLNLPAAFGISAASFFIGRIVRKSCHKRMEQSDDVFLDCLPGPVDNGNQNGQF